MTPVGDSAVLVHFADDASDETLGLVLGLDGALAASNVEGLVEIVPGQVNLLAVFDPLITDHGAIETAIGVALRAGPVQLPDAPIHEIEVCYDASLAPDLDEVAGLTGLSHREIVDVHLSGDYRVLMYGFAPGYAYLGGVPPELRLPRKSAAVRDVPAGSVILAGHQALVTTLTMPAGWWRIGASPTPLLPNDLSQPFPLDPGDRVAFVEIDLATYEARRASPEIDRT